MDSRTLILMPECLFQLLLLKLKFSFSGFFFSVLENKKDDDNSGENEVSPEQQLLWLLTVLNKVLFEKKNGAELPDDNKPTTLEEAITLWPEVTKGQVNSENVLHMLRVQVYNQYCTSMPLNWKMNCQADFKCYSQVPYNRFVTIRCKNYFGQYH